MKVQIDPYAGLTREDLVRLLRAETMRHENQSERVHALEKENEFQRKEFAHSIDVFRNAGRPRLHGYEADRIYRFLHEIYAASRKVLGLEKKYALVDFLYKEENKDAPGWELARLLKDLADYLDWGDE